MLSLFPALRDRRPLRVLCLGAHCDDIEIGCGGTILRLLDEIPAVEVRWVVLSAEGDRAREARRSAQAFLRRASRAEIVLESFRDGFFPSQQAEIKARFEALKSGVAPDLVLTHRLEDRHQDHRIVGELAWNTWRNHLILEYEIAKYEGDLGQPNFFVPIPARLAKRKARALMTHFATQRAKDWFVEENFLALARLRGLECRAPSGFAEAFHARKVVL